MLWLAYGDFVRKDSLFMAGIGQVDIADFDATKQREGCLSWRRLQG